MARLRHPPLCTSQAGTFALLLGVGLLALGCDRGKASPAPEKGVGEAAKTADESVKNRDSAAEKPAVVPLEARTRGWELGKRYGYGLKLSTSVSFDGKVASFDFDLAGKFEVVASSVSAEAASLYLSFSEVRIANRTPGHQNELERLTSELRRAGAFVTLTGGRASALDISPELSDMAMSTYRQLGAALQFARAEGDVQSYTAEEYDSTGKYLAEYQRAPGAASWLKRKRSYSSLLGAQSLAGSAGLSVTPDVFASSGEVGLSPEGRPERVKLADEIGLKGATSPLRSRVSLELSSLGVAPAAARDFSLLAGMRRVAASEPLRPVASAQALDDARIGNLDFETIVAELERRQSAKLEKAKEPADDTSIQNAAPTSETEVQADSRRFMALSAIFRKDPSAIQKAVARIQANSPATGDLLDTLSSASTPAAQSALVGLLGRKGIDKGLLARVVFSLSRAQDPTPQATRALRAVLDGDPFYAGALYGLGTHARMYRDLGRSAEAKDIGEFLLSRLKLAPGPTSLSTVLRALANSGYDGALPAVTEKLSDKREEVRVAALRAVQSMRDSRVDALLARYLLEDESPKARLSAIEAAALRQPSQPLVKALERAATHDADAHIRYRSVELMARWLPERPEMRAALKQVALKDEETKVRERAKALL